MLCLPVIVCCVYQQSCVVSTSDCVLCLLVIVCCVYRTYLVDLQLLASTFLYFCFRNVFQIDEFFSLEFDPLSTDDDHCTSFVSYRQSSVTLRVTSRAL